MFRSIPLTFVLVLCLAAATTASHSAAKCEADNKLFQGQVTTSEPVSEGDVNAVVDCKTRGGYATLQNDLSWFQVEMVQEACLSTVWVLPRNNVDGRTFLTVEFLAADGTTLSGINDVFTSQTGVWHRIRVSHKTCGVKSVLFLNHALNNQDYLQEFGYFELKAH